MNLRQVTITGADDSTHLAEMQRLSAEFPFLEWGLLVGSSMSDFGRPRFPGIQFFENLRRVQEAGILHRVSLHACGKPIRDLLEGNPLAFLHVPECGFARMQLNFHAEGKKALNLRAVQSILAGTAERFGLSTVIFQIDGGEGENLCKSVAARINETYEDDELPFTVAPFYDLSHGAGVLPDVWPPAQILCHYRGDPTYSGYGGGLSPENLAEELPKIAAAAGDVPFWIDVETRVRTPDDRALDMTKVRRFLEIAAPHVTP